MKARNIIVIITVSLLTFGFVGKTACDSNEEVEFGSFTLTADHLKAEPEKAAPTLQALPSKPLPSTSTDNIHRYFWANYNQFSGDYTKANIWYQKLRESDMSPHAYKGYVNFLAETGNFEHIVKLMPTIEKNFAEDMDMQQLFATALQQTGKIDEADKRFIELNNKFKNNQAIAFQTANIYLRKKEPENALLTIDSLLNTTARKPNNFIFHFLKAQIHVQLNQPQKALADVKASLDMHPHFDKGWLMLAVLEEQRGKLSEAVKGFTSFLETSAEPHPDIEQHLLQLAFKQKLQKQNASTVMVSKDCFSKAVVMFENKEYAPALEQIDQCLVTKTTDTQVRLLKIQILGAQNNHALAADQIKAWILEAPQDPTWYKTLHLLCRSGLSAHKAIAVLQDITKHKPKELLPLLYLADLTTRTKSLDTALSYHQKALELATDDLIKTKIMFQMGLIYYDQKKFSDMEKVLVRGNALGKDFIPLLNLLAYHYATQSKNLPEAQVLISKVLSKNKSNPHFLDTQALIFYKQKEYTKALDTLTIVAKQLPNDFTVLKHLGKTHHRLGNKQEAKAAIEKALTVAKHDHEKEKGTFILKEWTSNGTH